MNTLVKLLAKSGFLRNDFDYHFIRASMILIFLLFGYQKWWQYEAEALIPFFKNGPLIFWMYPVFGQRGASWFLGVSEWLTATLLILGFWNKKAGVVGATIAVATFISTITIIPFMPDGWDSAAGFPAMKGNVAFLTKDFVLFAASLYLLKQDVIKVEQSSTEASVWRQNREPRARDVRTTVAN